MEESMERHFSQSICCDDCKITDGGTVDPDVGFKGGREKPEEGEKEDGGENNCGIRVSLHTARKPSPYGGRCRRRKGEYKYFAFFYSPFRPLGTFPRRGKAFLLCTILIQSTIHNIFRLHFQFKLPECRKCHGISWHRQW